MDASTRQDALRASLRSWGRRQRSLTSERDPLVLGAISNGITREEIHILTGLGRTTVDRIAKSRQQEEGQS